MSLFFNFLVEKQLKFYIIIICAWRITFTDIIVTETDFDFTTVY